MATGSSAIAILILAIIASPISQASAHVGDREFPIFELPTVDLPDIYDGSMDDWNDVLPGISFDHNDFAPLDIGDGAGIDPSDLAYRVFLAWHDAGNLIYVAIERVDDAYVNSYDGGDPSRLFEHDGIEFMIDGDHSGGRYNRFRGVEEDQRKHLTNSQAQQYFAIAESPDNQTLGYAGAGNDWVVFPPYADGGGFNDGGESPNSSIIEMYVTPWDQLDWRGPESSVASDLTAGSIVGLQISVPDFDRGCWSCVGNPYHGFHTLSGVEGTYFEADRFVDAELVPCNTGDCSMAPKTVVQTDTWARIKASFR